MGGFTLNVLARFPPPWIHTAQRLIHHSLVHRILPQVTKDHTKVPIPKPGDPFTSCPITLNHDWEAFLTGWISDKMTDGLELANTLPSYIYAYRKGKSIDDLTLNHMMFLEDTQQFPHAISAALSDDIEKFFDRITVETQIVAMYQHGCPRHGYAEWIAETSYHSTALFATKHAHILLDVLCGAKQGSSLACPSSNVVASFKSKAFFPPPQLPHKPLVEGYAFQFNSRDARSTAQHLVLTIQSYCDDDTRYTAAIHISHLILQVQWSLDRAGDFSLITKLGRKHKKCSVAILNHPHDEPTPTFDSIAWSYDHAAPFTCNITTYTVTTTVQEPDSTNDTVAASFRSSIHTPPLGSGASRTAGR